jgi:hypothetical protein
MFGALSPQQMASLQQAMQMAQAMGAARQGGGQAAGAPMMMGMPGGGAHGAAALAGLMGAAGRGAGPAHPAMGGGMGGAMVGMQMLQQMMGTGAAPGFRPRTASVSPQPLRERQHHMGWIEKQGGIVKSWKKRYFVLGDNTLKYFASPADRSPKGTIVLNNIQQISEVGNAQAKIGLVLQTPHRAYLLRFDAEDVRGQWKTAIQTQLDTLRGLRPASLPATPAAAAAAAAATTMAASSSVSDGAVAHASFSSGSGASALPASAASTCVAGQEEGLPTPSLRRGPSVLRDFVLKT